MSDLSPIAEVIAAARRAAYSGAPAFDLIKGLRDALAAFDAAPAFDRADLESLARREQVETTYDLADDLAPILSSLLALALDVTPPHAVQAMSLDQAKALKVGQRVRVWATVDVFDEEEEEERETALGEVAQVTQIRTLGGSQGFAVTVDFLEGGYATFDEGDCLPLYPFSLEG